MYFSAEMLLLRKNFNYYLARNEIRIDLITRVHVVRSVR